MSLVGYQDGTDVWYLVLVQVPTARFRCQRTGKRIRLQILHQIRFCLRLPGGALWVQMIPVQSIKKPSFEIRFRFRFGLPYLLRSVILRMLLLFSLSHYLWVLTETPLVIGRQRLKYSWIESTRPFSWCHKLVFPLFVSMQANITQT